jgi:chitodextrinase
VPQNERLTGTTQTTATLAWSAAADNVGVTGYTLYLNGSKVTTTTRLSYTYTGLRCNTTYTVGLEAYDAAGNHSDKAYASGPATTTACTVADTTAPTTPGSLVVSSATQTSISVAWSASSDNVGVTGYGRYLNGTLVSSGTGTTYTFTGLTCGTSATIAVGAYDAAGNRSGKPSLTASTSACPDTTPPSTPKSLTATASGTQISLAWGASTDASGIARYNVYRATTSGFAASSSNLIAQPSGTSYVDTGLAAGTYYYKVTAADNAGNEGSASNQASATVVTPARSGLVAAYSFDAGSGSKAIDQSGKNNTGSLSNATWAGSSAGRFGNAVSFNGRNSSVIVPDSTSLHLASAATLEAWVKPSKLANWNSVVFKAGSGWYAAALYANTDTNRPSGDLFTNADKEVFGSSQLPLNVWTHLATTYNGSSLALYVNGTQVGTLATSGSIGTNAGPLSIGGNAVWSEWFSGLIDEVRVYDRSLSASEIKADMATPIGSGSSPADTTAPTVPGSLAATGVTASSITLSWSASTDNVGMAGYGRYQNGTLLSSGAATSFTFVGLACGTSYTLAVDAYDTAGNRSAKASATAATSACPDTSPPTAPAGLVKTAATATSLSVSWLASTDNVGVSGYNVYLNGVLKGMQATTSYSFSGLACGTTYTVGVEALDAAGNTSPRSTLSASTSACADTQAPSVPAALSVGSVTQTGMTLSWAASTDNVGVAGYDVYVNGAKDDTVTSTTDVLTDYTCGTTYALGVVAFDTAGDHSSQATVDGTTSACSDTQAPSTPSGLSAAGSDTANLWVDTNGGSCVRQATAGGYVDGQACSWNQAYQAAQTGDLILVKGGNYGNVTIGPNKSSIAAPGVTFRPATGETVAVNDFENGYIGSTLGGSNINFAGPVTAHTFRSDGTSNVSVDNWTVNCGGCNNIQIFHVEQGTNVKVTNSDISNNQNNSLIWLNGTGITFEHDVIHDAGLPAGSPNHTECMYAWAVTNLTLKRNHFYHCSVMDVFITGSAVSNGGYVENNVFEKPWEYTGKISSSALAFQFRNGGDPSPDPNNWDFRYNTFVGPLNISSENPVGSGGMRVIGNVFLASAPCGLANTTYDYNAFVSGSCGTHATTASLATYQSGFTSTADPGNYSLNSGSVLRDKGNNGNCPSQDLAGTARYKGAAPDIGAYEGL